MGNSKSSMDEWLESIPIVVRYMKHGLPPPTRVGQDCDCAGFYGDWRVAHILDELDAGRDKKELMPLLHEALCLYDPFYKENFGA